MRVLVPVAIVAIIALTVLSLAALARRQELARARRLADELAVTLTKIRNELATQTAAHYFDPIPVQAILADFDERERNTR